VLPATSAEGALLLLPSGTTIGNSIPNQLHFQPTAFIAIQLFYKLHPLPVNFTSSRLPTLPTN
jgi:hypothetical protein